MGQFMNDVLRGRGTVFFVFMALIVAASWTIPAAAQIQNFSLTVTPATAAVGSPRQLRLSVFWPQFCYPPGVTVVENDPAKRKVTLRMDRAFDASLLYLCDTYGAPYETTVNYTPQFEGDIDLLVVSSNGVYFGEATLHTRNAARNRALFDLSGTWSDPASYGSGLTFFHGFARSDQVFGTWFVYDAQGVPRWYSIQDVQWSAGGTVAEGNIYETGASSVVCLPPYTSCPVASTFLSAKARARITVQGANTAQVQAISPAGVTLFASNITRALF